MIRIYITKFTFTGEFGSYVVSNPMMDHFNTMTDVGRIELSCYYADQDPSTRLPKSDVVICVLKGGSVIDGIQLPGVQQLPVGKRDRLLSTLSTAARTRIGSVVQTIDPEAQASQFTTIGDVILYIIRSVKPNFSKFGGVGYDDGAFD